VNDALLTLVESEEKKLTALTRFKLVAAVSKAAGIVNVQPSTIKQFFFERSSRTGRRKKN
jgi:hypothetical protein